MTEQNFMKMVWTVFEKFEIFMKGREKKKLFFFRLQKKSPYNSGVSLHEAPTKIKISVLDNEYKLVKSPSSFNHGTDSAITIFLF